MRKINNYAPKVRSLLIKITILASYSMALPLFYELAKRYFEEKNTIIVQASLKYKWDDVGKELEISPDILDAVFRECHSKIEKKTNKRIRYSAGVNYGGSTSVRIRKKKIPDYTDDMGSCVWEELVARKEIKGKSL